MQQVIVQPQTQRHAIGHAARFGHLGCRQRATRHRHAQVPARLAWRICRPRHLDLRLLRHGTRRARKNGAELIEGCVVAQGAGPIVWRQTIFWPVLAQSARKPSMPLSVSTCLNRPLMTAGGAVITSAPILALSSTWMPWRTEATRISVSNA